MITLENEKELNLAWMFICLVLSMPLLVCSVFWFFHRDLPHENLLVTMTVLFCLWWFKRLLCLILFLFKKEK